MHFLVSLILVLACVNDAFSDDIPTSEPEFSSNRTSRVLKPSYKSPDPIVYKSGGYFGREVDPSSFADNSLTSKKDSPPKTPRGFADFVSGDQEAYSQPADDHQNRGWSPYYLPPLSDSMYDSSSSMDWNVWKREDDRFNNNADPSYPTYNNPDMYNMIMMMQAMKKMDPNSGSRPGLLTRILDNPTTLVMATFIPISLLLVAALPVIMNVVMNGISIPAIVSTSAGAKTRGHRADNSTDLLRPILESLADFNSRYLDSNDCFQKIFCEMTKENTTTVTNVSGAKHLRQAINVATLIVSDDLLNSYGIKTLVNSVKTGKCEEIYCAKESRSLSPSLLRVINEAIYSYNFKGRPNTR